jgi:iron complex outermembrane recepter protein
MNDSRRRTLSPVSVTGTCSSLYLAAERILTLIFRRFGYFALLFTCMRTLYLILAFLISGSRLLAQPDGNREIRLTISTGNMVVPANVTVSLLKKDSSVLQSKVTDNTGAVSFSGLPADYYICRISRVDYKTYHTPVFDLYNSVSVSETIVLHPETGVLKDVTVTSKKPFVQYLPDKTVINIEAGITNAGATVMEVLERSPGITIDREGNISLKGRPAVQVMIDGKLTQLGGADLQNLLSGMNASQVESIELIENPGAKYDAAGNAGIINIKTKKNKQRGFNGSVSTSYGQGRFPKNNNSLVLNLRSGKLNFFATYSMNQNRSFFELYALRSYYGSTGNVTNLLEQDAYTKSKIALHTLKTGVDYFASNKTTLGVAFTGTTFSRASDGRSPAVWKNATGNPDSIILTTNHNTSEFDQAGINFNARHTFSASREWSADIDYIAYGINTTQYFENRLITSSSLPEASKGEIPTDINIFSARTDYSHRFNKILWEAGLKTSRVSTDNLAQYYLFQNNQWEEDLGKSNHFLYTENIHAAYSSIDTKMGRWSMQGGLRYEYTGYKATQLGNAVNKDSSFNRNYNSLFPTAFITYEADSASKFTLRAGRRIDRPVFQKLNPFLFIINKYTFQRGNPFFRPQYTWNIELTHVYKEVLSTSISYNYTKDYFSQVFLSDTSTGIIIYTEGNVGRAQNVGLSVSAQLTPTSWWSLSAQANYNYKKIEGVLWKDYKATINQLNLSVNNQFRFKKGWGAELSGFYITRAQNDLQEVLDPTGQVSLGISKQVLKTKGSIRLTVRDVFYTQAMQGWTYFESVVEYFKLMRDTRVATIAFTYRFGKAMKQPKRSAGAEEVNRVGTGN